MVFFSVKFAGKWVVIEQNHPELSKPDSERQTRCVHTHKWILHI